MTKVESGTAAAADSRPPQKMTKTKKKSMPRGVAFSKRFGYRFCRVSYPILGGFWVPKRRQVGTRMGSIVDLILKTEGIPPPKQWILMIFEVSGVEVEIKIDQTSTEKWKPR